MGLTKGTEKTMDSWMEIWITKRKFHLIGCNQSLCTKHTYLSVFNCEQTQLTHISPKYRCTIGCLVWPFQLLRVVMKGSDVSPIHERLVTTCVDENSSLSLYWVGCSLQYTQVVGCAACQPPGRCIFSQDKSKNLSFQFKHEGEYGAATTVRNSGLVTQKAKLCLCIIYLVMYLVRNQPNTPKSKFKLLWVKETNNVLLHGREVKVSFTAWRGYVYYVTNRLSIVADQGTKRLNSGPWLKPLL